ncbi:MAG: TonB-dependent receptor, partial [Chloroflexota bacterium]
ATTVNHDAIEKLNQGKDMPLILEHLPATVSTSDAGTGIGYSTFRIRGTDMNRINITVNGIPLNDAESHSVYFVNMPDFASSVSSVQVQRGVGSSTNGAAAFGASVNMQTQPPAHDAYGIIGSSYGSFNTFKNTVSAGTGLMDNKWAVDARLSKLSSDGYIDRASADLKSFYLSSGYYGKSTILKFNVFSGIEKTYQAWDGVPSNLLGINRTFNGMGAYSDNNGNSKFYENETDNYQQDHYQFILAQSFSPKTILNFALHYTRGKGYYEQYKDNANLSDYCVTDTTGGNMETDLIRRKHLDNDFYGYTFSLNYQPINRMRLTFGNSGNIYDGNHFGRIIWAENALPLGHDFEWYRGTGKKKDLNVFTKANFQVTGRLSLYGDLQLRAINYEISGIDDDLRNIAQKHNFLFFNPKAGAFLDIHSYGSIYASLAVAHREPNRDNYTDADPSKQKPVAEKLFDYELGYQYSKPTLQLNANIYYMSYRDQLILTGDINDVGSAIMMNVDKSYRTGIELSGTYMTTNKLSFGANLAISQNKIIDFTEKVDNWNSGEQVENSIGTTNLAFSPTMVGGFDLTWKPVNNLSASFDGKYVSRQYIDNTSSEDRSLDPYFINNLRFSYSVKPKFLKELVLELNVNNLFNVKYETNAWVYKFYYEGQYWKYDGYFPQAGINVMGGITVKL